MCRYRTRSTRLGKRELRRDGGLFLCSALTRQVGVSNPTTIYEMDFMLFSAGAIEALIAVCFALLVGLAAYLVLT